MPEVTAVNHILFIEDDPVIGRGLKVNLELENYQVTWVETLASARSTPEQKFSLLILDLGLPDGDGLTFLKDFRKTDQHTPVLVLTARTDEDSVVEGLTSGANDYVRKPFGQKEIMARISLLLRAPRRDPQFEFADLKVMKDLRKVVYKGQNVDLNRREFDILCFFIEKAESVVTRQALLSVLDKDGEISDRTIDSHVSHLRSRLRHAQVDGIHISSVYGVGYRLERK